MLALCRIVCYISPYCENLCSKLEMWDRNGEIFLDNIAEIVAKCKQQNIVENSMPLLLDKQCSANYILLIRIYS